MPAYLQAMVTSFRMSTGELTPGVKMEELIPTRDDVSRKKPEKRLFYSIDSFMDDRLLSCSRRGGFGVSWVSETQDISRDTEP